MCSNGHNEGKTKDGKCKRCTYDRNKRWIAKQSDEWKANRKARMKELGAPRWKSRHIKRKYGLSGDQFNAMLTAQNGKCAICGASPNGKVLFVDHCHSTGEVRGLLCHGCNSGLGYFRDSASIMALAITYLKNQEDLHLAGKRQPIPFSSPVRAYTHEQVFADTT